MSIVLSSVLFDIVSSYKNAIILRYNLYLSCQNDGWPVMSLTTNSSRWNRPGGGTLNAHWYTTEIEAEVTVAKEPTRGSRRTAKDRALHYVKDQILTGAFPGGELISEGEVADALSMSRTPVREAFLRMEAEGLLRLYPQRGALVIPVSAQEVRAVIEARLVLEQFAAGKVAGQSAEARGVMSDRMSSELARQRQTDAAGDRREFSDADRAFHAILIEAAGNSILQDVYNSLRDRQMRMIGESAVREPARTETILAEHKEIAEALRDGDRDRSLDAIKAHLAGTQTALGIATEGGDPAD
jgi:DNA-binding GntR family transcriptional regulator